MFIGCLLIANRRSVQYQPDFQCSGCNTQYSQELHNINNHNSAGAQKSLTMSYSTAAKTHADHKQHTVVWECHLKAGRHTLSVCNNVQTNSRHPPVSTTSSIPERGRTGQQHGN
jgi:hypothetical protein